MTPGGGPLTAEKDPAAAQLCIDNVKDQLSTLGVTAGATNLKDGLGAIRQPVVNDYVAFLGLNRDVAAYRAAFAEASRIDIDTWMSRKFDDDPFDERVLRAYLECTRGGPPTAACGPAAAGLTPLEGSVQTSVDVDPPSGYAPVSFIVYLRTRVTTEATLTYQLPDDIPPGLYAIGLAGHGTMATLGPQGSESPGWWQEGVLPQLRVVARSPMPAGDISSQPPAEAGHLPTQQAPGQLAVLPEFNEWAALGFVFLMAYGGPLIFYTPAGKVSAALDASEALAGRDVLTGEPLNPAQRIVGLIPFVGDVLPSARMPRPATSRAWEDEKLARDLANATVEGYGGVVQQLAETEEPNDSGH